MRRTVGTSDEIESLYRQHGSALVLFATSLLGNRTVAQDVVHQVFLRLIENNGLGPAEDKKAYVFASVRNAVLNERKFQQRSAPLDPDSDWFVSPTHDHAEELDLRRALWSLPEDQREVIVLHLWGDLTFAQIGNTTGISANTAASRYRYALSKLREAMFTKEDFCAEPGRREI